MVPPSKYALPMTNSRTKGSVVLEQSLPDPSEVYTEYPDPRRDEWSTKILPRVRAMSMRELMEWTGLPRSTLQAIWAGRRPRAAHRELLASAAGIAAG